MIGTFLSKSCKQKAAQGCPSYNNHLVTSDDETVVEVTEIFDSVFVIL